ncbi:MAG: hypothetical protein RIS51_141 [Actinomycetota bacterium]
MIPVIAAAVWLIAFVMSLIGAEFEPRWENSFPTLDYLESLRAQFLKSALGVTQDSKALVLGLTIGERDLLSENLAAHMKQLSLTHLVAVSGANLAIVAGAIYFVAAKLSIARNLRFAIALIALGLYVLLVGPEPSVLRAFVMTLAVLIAIWLGRGTQPVVALCWAVLLIIISDPAMATNFGFALSAFATLGLLLVGHPLYLKLASKLPKWLALGLATALAAQLYTLPILLFLDPSIPAYAVFANLLVEPAVAPVTILGIFSVISLPLSSELSSAISWVASLGTYWIEMVASELSNFPFVRLHWLPGWVGVFTAILLAGLISLWVLGVRAKQSSMVAAVLFAFSLSWISTDVIRFSSWPNQDWDVVMCDVGQGDGFVIKSDGAIALVDVGREDQPIDDCLTQLGVSRIDLLILSHFDLDHAGGISGAVSGRSIGRVLVTGFQDDRPVVEKVKTAIFEKGLGLDIAQTSLAGELGSATWRVLSPSANAREASDANDASVVLRFDFEQFSLLLLGDLGENGQERLMRLALKQLSDLPNRKVLLKVAHHGSKDQSEKFHHLVQSDLALISVGANNDYGHPTQKTLGLLARSGATVVRTDLSGSVGIRASGENFEVFSTGKLAK